MKNKTVNQTYVALDKLCLLVFSFLIFYPVFSQTQVQKPETISDSSRFEKENLQPETTTKTTIYVADGTTIIGLEHIQENIKIVHLDPKKINKKQKDSKKETINKKSVKSDESIAETKTQEPERKTVLKSEKSENHLLGFDFKNHSLVLPTHSQNKTTIKTNPVKFQIIPVSEFKKIYSEPILSFGDFYYCQSLLRGPPGLGFT